MHGRNAWLARTPYPTTSYRRPATDYQPLIEGSDPMAWLLAGETWLNMDQALHVAREGDDAVVAFAVGLSVGTYPYMQRFGGDAAAAIFGWLAMTATVEAADNALTLSAVEDDFEEELEDEIEDAMSDAMEAARADMDAILSMSSGMAMGTGMDDTLVGMDVDVDVLTVIDEETPMTSTATFDMAMNDNETPAVSAAPSGMARDDEEMLDDDVPASAASAASATTSHTETTQA